ncbi:hypothetical protein AAFF_G00108670 [Aldrovandia affinis]|uniref:Uncharacterized protein n=1 Tax=Aldrovandia affinis TaxID=143900 RepID=A0AAD7WB79_9TELE|nr:hypothetical protein AAFF_G00108670 [Aldrovandia affinis]
MGGLALAAGDGQEEFFGTGGTPAFWGEELAGRPNWHATHPGMLRHHGNQFAQTVHQRQQCVRTLPALNRNGPTSPCLKSEQPSITQAAVGRRVPQITASVKNSTHRTIGAPFRVSWLRP